MNKNTENSEPMSPTDYYKNLSRPLKSLFKTECQNRMEWSHATFQRRMETGDLKSHEKEVMESIINEKSYLNLEADV